MLGWRLGLLSSDKPLHLTSMEKARPSGPPNEGCLVASRFRTIWGGGSDYLGHGP